MDDIKKLLNQGEIDLARTRLLKLINADNENYDAIHFLGLTYLMQDKIGEAINLFLKAISIKKDYISAYCNLSNAYAKMKKYQEALIVLKKALDIDKYYFDANFNISIVYYELHDYSQCINFALIAKGLSNNNNLSQIDLLIGRGMSNIGKISHAVKFIEKIKNNKFYANIYEKELAEIFFKARDFVKSLDHYKIYLQTNPNDYSAHQNIAICYAYITNFEKSEEHLNKSLAYCKTEDIKSIVDTLLFMQNYNPQINSEKLKDLYLKYSSNYLEANKEVSKFSPFSLESIGFISSDFHRSSISNFLLPFVEELSKIKTVYLINTNSKSDSITELYKKCNVKWLDLSNNNDIEHKVKEISKCNLDLLVETSGRGEGNQLEILKHKPAKKMMSWLGYGYSSGLNNIDYFLTDSIILDENNKKNYIEDNVITKESPFAIYKPIANLDESKSPFIENGFVTFGYLSRSIRLNDLMIDSIGLILKNNKKTKILFNYIDYQFIGMQNLIKTKLKKYDVEEKRIIFGFDSPIDKAFEKIDIYLDSFPHNSGTTIIEALYCGVPIITLQNDHIMGRVGKSILHNINKNDWVAESLEQFINIAIEMSTKTDDLLYYRKNLRSMIQKSDLMDYPKFVNSFLNSIK